MPVYAYKCRECGVRRDSTNSSDIRPCSCGGLSKRDYSSVRMGATGLVPHFSHAVGQYVSSNREFDDALKRAAEANTIRTGAEHSYVRLDPGDVPQPNVATEAFEAREKTIRDAI